MSTPRPPERKQKSEARSVLTPGDRVYALHGAGRIPIERKSDLDRWIRDGGGKRP